jgi:hypothetical protein
LRTGQVVMSAIDGGSKMPKGKMTGNPTNIICWLEGGHFDGTVWGIAYDRDNLLGEISLTHYKNARAEAAGVKILGITRQGPDDLLVEETYELCYFQDNPPAFAIFATGDALASFQSDPDTFVNMFKADKGYNLPAEHLDPKNMPGEKRSVDVG